MACYAGDTACTRQKLVQYFEPCASRQTLLLARLVADEVIEQHAFCCAAYVGFRRAKRTCPSRRSMYAF